MNEVKRLQKRSREENFIKDSIRRCCLIGTEKFIIQLTSNLGRVYCKVSGKKGMESVGENGLHNFHLMNLIVNDEKLIQFDTIFRYEELNLMRILTYFFT